MPAHVAGRARHCNPVHDHCYLWPPPSTALRVLLRPARQAVLLCGRGLDHLALDASPLSRSRLHAEQLQGKQLGRTSRRGSQAAGAGVRSPSCCATCSSGQPPGRCIVQQRRQQHHFQDSLFHHLWRGHQARRQLRAGRQVSPDCATDPCFGFDHANSMLGSNSSSLTSLLPPFTVYAGNWDVDKAAELKWTQGDTWTTTLSLPTGNKYEYKVSEQTIE